ncbi:MAG: hypothetical protein AVO33_04320 [delta proteobacterium ML8_F1]|nr:MAG: hypothetical protein AVO33_04320 [delta proteobacterium ML8_F1]
MQPNDAAARNSETVSVKEWIITSLIMMIPLVNLIMPFVWAFSSNTKSSKANYFRALLLLTLAGLVLYILFAGAVAGQLFRLLSSFNG